MGAASSSLPAGDAIAAAEEARLRRRDVLRGGAALLATLAAPKVLGACAADVEPVDGPRGSTRAPLRRINVDVGIVGAGIAGLACANELRRAGVTATLHEAAERVGGRVWSMGGSFAGPVDWRGQVIERGGELIDTGHKTMIGYARELGLSLEEVTKPKRETFYHFGGERIPEHVFVDEYRALVDAMRDDLRVIAAPTADAFTPQEEALDRMSLAEWLETRGAAPRIKALLSVAYEIEYGVSTAEQSALAFLLFAKASRQSKLRLFGNFSDERYHVIGGNQQIPAGLAARMPGQIRHGRRLVAARKLSDGRVELTFVEGKKAVTATHDAVVFAIPFPLLREVSLEGLGLPDWKKGAIARSLYGANTKLMVGFDGQPWIEQGGNGSTYSDMPALQATWETNPSLGDASRAVITDYTGGALARSVASSKAQVECERFLSAFDRIVPGAKARARAERGKFVCHVENWQENTLARGGYTANQPGYFTTLEGLEGRAVGNLYFAGETTDSFYSWQGFMEGGALSGLRVAAEIGRDF
ncbi:MAG TPA: NAD(P)/FAD-dependent oxidoreductase [Gaiellaceae bacterium]|nr:NAD(P)/FAD-dependent oxidoreductase [Gaiellaceae bacterium]